MSKDRIWSFNSLPEGKDLKVPVASWLLFILMQLSQRLENLFITCIRSCLFSPESCTCAQQQTYGGWQVFLPHSSIKLLLFCLKFLQGKIILMAAIWLAMFFCFQTAGKIYINWVGKVFETCFESTACCV